MQNVNKELYDLLGQAQAVRLAVQYRAITYEEGKQKVEAILAKLNDAGERIAQKYGRKHRKITFANLGRNF